MKLTVVKNSIQQLHDLPALTPVVHNYLENWNIRIVNREVIACGNYLSPNRRDFYKILFIKNGMGIFSLGMNNYCIEKPTILFLHPSEIISWQNLSEHSAGYYCLFKKKYVDAHPVLRLIMNKYNLFTDISKSVIKLHKPAVEKVDAFFNQMLYRAEEGGTLAEDAMQAYLQLILIESVQNAEFPLPDTVSGEFRHIHNFFKLLESEVSNINYGQSIKIKTVKEFADQLALHPNHLNALLKKNTGLNVSTHIRNRLLEESKALLLQTDWPIHEIGYCIGFTDQPNFTQFFKKNSGLTPRDFRKSYSTI
nr:AraC family transcriptional regulator [Pedobacter sp. ASV2]